MTPNNIVNMAKLKGLDFIAISDHNSCKNCRSAIIAGERAGLLVLPAMELTTAEDIHVLCLFRNLDDALEFDQFVYSSMFKIKNKTNIYGEQLILDENDNPKGSMENLLIVASGIPFHKASSVVMGYNGFAIPAHIDKKANSVISILGSLEKDMGYDTAELSKGCDKTALYSEKPYLSEYKAIVNSDAHYLWDISEKTQSILLPELSKDSVFNALLGIK